MHRSKESATVGGKFTRQVGKKRDSENIAHKLPTRTTMWTRGSWSPKHVDEQLTGAGFTQEGI